MSHQTGPTLRLILGDQLSPLHSWFGEVRADVVYVLMEVRSETDYVRHHAQKVLGIFAAMRALAAQLKAEGHRLRYVAIDDTSNRQSLTANLDALIAHYGAAAVEYQAPDEWRLDQQLSRWGADCAVPVQAVDSEHFYTARDEAARQFAGKKQWLMESFYRQQRKKHRVLMTHDGQPEGGQWNFDADNRKPWAGTPAADRASAYCRPSSRSGSKPAVSTSAAGSPARLGASRGDARQSDHWASSAMYWARYQAMLWAVSR